MDTTDLHIAKLLLSNCRITYRDIAKTFELSVNAVYKRVQNMINSGVIRAFTARPSLIGLKAINVLIAGKSEGRNINDISGELGSHESIFFVGNAGGNYLYIDGYLREISELENYTANVSKIAKLHDFITCIKELPYRINPEVLTKTDYRILRVLVNDAKRSLADIAEDIGLSAKTVRKRIKRMMEYNLVEFSINFAPQTEGTIVCQFHAYLNQKKDYNSEYKRIEEKYYDYILYLQRFTNISNLLMITALTKSNREAATLYSKFQEEDYEKVEYNIIYNGFFFDTWRDLLYREILSS
ncbi:MAG: AsnC family transcriptional regulator [Promethearchaeota archaeon]|jgi:DNA-binding Lrp family transcriptional regulator